MTKPDTPKADPDAQAEAGPKPLTPAAERALAEAAARRAATASGAGSGAGRPADAPAEIGGRDGPEPTRYGDWEKGGIASDF
jgi:hypothetical protein